MVDLCVVHLIATSVQFTNYVQGIPYPKESSINKNPESIVTTSKGIIQNQNMKNRRMTSKEKMTKQVNEETNEIN